MVWFVRPCRASTEVQPGRNTVQEAPHRRGWVHVAADSTLHSCSKLLYGPHEV